MPRAGLSTAIVVGRAAELLDANPTETLNLAAVADSLGVRVPSLYKHVDGMPGLVLGMTLLAKTGLVEAMSRSAVGLARDDAIRSMAHAYRRWALEHPGQYPLTTRIPAADRDEELAVSAALLDLIFTVLAGYDLRDTDAVDATRFFRSTLHGFVALETGGGFGMPFDLDRSFETLVQSVVTAFASWER
ncbi:TetR-like C-terminal domain-containing protein [Marisediminicola sp. LYQ134]|uniref:TetR-like C-terminal domain-containing protein n=1 Tax=unclassified Marisediminicola TaxID=2618316 RepID=UPI00398361D3